MRRNAFLLGALWNREEVKNMKGYLQNEWHKYDVYKHTKEVYKAMYRKNPSSLDLHAAAILHDIGKVPTSKENKDAEGSLLYAHGHVSYGFPDHEKKGMEMILEMPEKLFTNVDLDQKNIAEIVGKHRMIQYHAIKMRNHSEDIDDMKRHLSNLLEELTQENECMRNNLLEIFYADSMGRGYPERIELDLAMYSMLRRSLDIKDLDLKKLHRTALRMHRRFDLHRC